jgi:hypothetical protein
MSALEECVMSRHRNIANFWSEDHALKGLVTDRRIARVTRVRLQQGRRFCGASSKLCVRRHVQIVAVLQL